MSFFFSFRVKLIHFAADTHTTTTTHASASCGFLQRPVLSKRKKKEKKMKKKIKSLSSQVFFKENMEFRVVTSPISRTGVSHRLFRTDTFIFLLPFAGRLFEKDRSSQATNDIAPPPLPSSCWRHQHLTLHTTNCDVPTAFELLTPSAPLWNTTTTTKKTFLLQQDFFFSSSSF